MLGIARSTLVYLPGPAEVDKVLDMLMGKDVAARDIFSVLAELRHKEIEEAIQLASCSHPVQAKSP